MMVRGQDLPSCPWAWQRVAGYSSAILLSGAGESVLIQQLYQCVSGMESIGSKRQSKSGIGSQISPVSIYSYRPGHLKCSVNYALPSKTLMEELPCLFFSEDLAGSAGIIVLDTCVPLSWGNYSVQCMMLNWNVSISTAVNPSATDTNAEQLK